MLSIALKESAFKEWHIIHLESKNDRLQRAVNKVWGLLKQLRPLIEKETPPPTPSRTGSLHPESTLLSMAPTDEALGAGVVGARPSDVDTRPPRARKSASHFDTSDVLFQMDGLTRALECLKRNEGTETYTKDDEEAEALSKDDDEARCLWEMERLSIHEPIN